MPTMFHLTIGFLIIFLLIENKLLSNKFVRDGTELAVAEMLLGGTTCFNDMYFFAEETARVCIDAGTGGQHRNDNNRFPIQLWLNVEEYLRKGQTMA